MKYQDLKIRDGTRLALIGAILAIFSILGISKRSSLEPMAGQHYWPIVCAIVFMCPIVILVSVWYFLSSPEQDAKFLSWAERNLGQKPGPKFNPKLLDANDPDYRTPTFRYFLAKRRGEIS